mmetsp:Transcript_69853/g.113433  ORF Transcript_69853/g.113433 Transcript_69853/m.113433 type:complete len:86 (+) Transcript_69853:229-486(+)
MECAKRPTRASRDGKKKEILRKKELALMAERAAKKSPAAVKMARDAQARKSEAQVLALLGTLPAGAEEKKLELQDKLKRIREQLS